MEIVSVRVRIFADSLATVEDIVTVDVRALTMPLILDTVELMLTVSVNVLILADNLVGVELIVTVSVNDLTAPLTLRTVEEIVTVSVKALSLPFCVVRLAVDIVTVSVAKALDLADRRATVEEMVTVDVMVLILFRNMAKDSEIDTV